MAEYLPGAVWELVLLFDDRWTMIDWPFRSANDF